MQTTQMPSMPAPPQGRAGEFDFLTGEWRIANLWRSGPHSTEWLEFPGEATVVGILGGLCSVEELRIPARDFHGMGLRLLNQETMIWHDHWVNKRSGAISAPGEQGGFVDGVGTWSSTSEENGRITISQGVWDQITPNSTRWRQRVSADDGASWQETWIMHWTRA